MPSRVALTPLGGTLTECHPRWCAGELHAVVLHVVDLQGTLVSGAVSMPEPESATPLHRLCSSSCMHASVPDSSRRADVVAADARQSVP